MALVCLFANPLIAGVPGSPNSFEKFDRDEGSAPSGGQGELVVGRWEGARHITEYRPDGTFALDPEPGEWIPLGKWKVEGGVLIMQWKDSGETDRSTIVSIDSRQMTIRAANGKEYQLKKLP